ncbi:FAD dependent oxidoreductase [Xylariaceae sp. FL0255]|nr:FAD dependent oxidoreductase [Xylariaceae sp. FL0255]
MSPKPGHDFVVLGAGVIGLTTALCLRESYPQSSITILARHFPGDYHVDYISPWAGGNWCSSATDNGLLEECDRVAFNKFRELAARTPECGVERSPLRMIFDQKAEDAGILSEGTGKIWYESLVGGLDEVPKAELPPGSVFGLEMRSTFVINVQVYLHWLLARCRDTKITLIRQKISHIREARLSPSVTAIFNCTGLGSYNLGGVEDKSMYPTRGQTVLVEQPLIPLKKMYFRSPARVDNDTTYIFQRPLGGGIVLGGCRENGNWSGEVDLEFSKVIIQRCCALAPELGTPEEVERRIIKHGVGLRPSRKGGPRIEVERLGEGDKGLLVIHNYGASGAGYQASWGMAQHGVALFKEVVKVSGRTSRL